MIPLANILGDFTEELAMHTNQTIGGLLSATFGNAVEVVVSIRGLHANQFRVVQASMLGSTLSNLLLVLGCCLMFGGFKYKEQHFNSTFATANMSLLALSSVGLVLPTPFADYYDVQDEAVLQISRLTAVFLVSMYVQSLIFQLFSHADLFEDEDDDEEPEISFVVALIGLMATVMIVEKFSDYLIGSIDEFVEESGISKTFVGLILLPIIGNAVEHITAVTVAMKNKMDLAMNVAIGSCTQIQLFVVPFTVLYGWFIGKNMTLNFPHFEIEVLILSIIIVYICLGNKSTCWLYGSLLVTLYVMIAIAFYKEHIVSYR